MWLGEKYMWDSNLVERALFMATKAHMGQMLKYPEDIPYSAHFTGVLLNVLNYCNDEDLDWNLVCCCAILHDTIEDTYITFDNINYVMLKFKQVKF
ncbi:MAG: hypothetical protein SOV27_03935 [Eubacteriales bacterium]|nr:hypothetical protein [Eubacteriales bacterium]